MMEIVRRHLPQDAKVRPGTTRPATHALIYHWTGVARQSPERVWEHLAEGHLASPHYVLWRRDVWEIVPPEQVGYHSGADDPASYTRVAKDAVGIPPWKYSIAVEMVPEDKSGRFAADTIESALCLGVDLCKRYRLNPFHCVFRHYDLTGKICPKWFVEHSDKWTDFITKMEEMVEKEDAFERQHTYREWKGQY